MAKTTSKVIQDPLFESANPVLLSTLDTDATATGPRLVAFTRTLCLLLVKGLATHARSVRDLGTGHGYSLPDGLLRTFPRKTTLGL